MNLRAAQQSAILFSPPVMMVTFVLEACLALYVLWRYRQTRVTQLAVVLLCFLAVFQAAEFMVCQYAGGTPLLWSRIGYAAITILPALGVHLAYELTSTKKRPFLLPAYLAASVMRRTVSWPATWRF